MVKTGLHSNALQRHISFAILAPSTSLDLLLCVSQGQGVSFYYIPPREHPVEPRWTTTAMCCPGEEDWFEKTVSNLLEQLKKCQKALNEFLEVTT